MWIDLPNIWIAVINILGIPLCHLGIAWLSTCLPERLFHKETPDTSHQNGLLYEKLFLVRRWKHLLPDAAPWFKGFPKGSLDSTDHTYLKSFVSETRRGEYSHWLQTLLILLFVVWTPYPACIIIIVYAIISNAPCIINLRYTRLRILSFINKKYSNHHVR